MSNRHEEVLEGRRASGRRYDLLTDCPSLLFSPSRGSQVGEAEAGQQAGGQLREQGLEDGGLLAREDDGEGAKGEERKAQIEAGGRGGSIMPYCTRVIRASCCRPQRCWEGRRGGGGP